jgi:AcrR family transcriptional regulator
MPRKYELKARAQRQQQTRRRIVEAAVELHRTKGPARTTLSDVARLAGVERHTLYRHFPDERALGLACSGHFTELNPPPRAEPWTELADPAARLQRGLGELYAYFGRTEDMLSCILRDAEVDLLTRELVQLRAGEAMGEIRRILAEPLQDRRALAALDLALDFHAWRRLSHTGLGPDECAALMTTAILAQ